MKLDWRSLLFVSAADERRVAGVGQRGADAVILDLEDAVALDIKPHARAQLPDAVSKLAEAGVSVVVRVNSGWRDLVADLAAASQPGVAALMIPKVEDAGRLGVVAEIVEEHSVASGRRAPPLVALVESPAGIAGLSEIAAIPQLCAIAFGTEDFALAMRAPPAPALLELPCKMVALAAARHGLMALGLPVSIATIGDIDAWEAGARHARAIGMSGALCVHPAQVAVANEAFAPTQPEVEAARLLIAAWDAADGHSGVIQFDGRMIDLPVIRAAQQTVARHAKSQRRFN